MPSKTLIITSCCKEKLDHAAPAKDLYMGKLFTLVKQYAEETGSDLRILSAKHGLISPEQVIEPYDLQITGRAQIDPLQETVLPALAAIWDNYQKVIVIMGSQYLKVINPLLKRQGNWKMASNVTVEVVHDERGIGGLLQQVKNRIKAAAAIKSAAAQGLKYVGPANAVSGSGHLGYYTRVHFPELCKSCKHKACTFEQARKAALRNGDDNPASTPCDYCCKWDNEASPDKFEPEEKPMAEQPKPEEKPEEKKAETKEPEPSEFGRICGGCEKPIKPGTPGMRQHPKTGRWYHPEHYPKNICTGCGGVADGLLHDCVQDTYWCATCWGTRPGIEGPKKPSKRSRQKPKGHAAPDRNLPLADRQAAYSETPEYPYEQWPVAAEGEIDLWGAIAVRNIPRPEDSTKAPGIIRAFDKATASAKEDAEIKALLAGKSPTTVENCPRCRLPKVKGTYDNLEICHCDDQSPEQKQAFAGMRLYQIFAMHAAQIAALLSKEEQVEMNTLAEALSIE